MNDARYSIGELAKRTGVTRRTVRYYVQRGLIPQPLGRGRGEHYSEEHLTALLRVKSLQEQGASLDDIRRHLTGEHPEANGDATPRAPMVEARPSPGDNRWTPRRSIDGLGHRTAAEDGSHLASRPGQMWFRQVVMPGHELHVLGAENALTERQLAALARFINNLKDEGGGDEI